MFQTQADGIVKLGGDVMNIRNLFSNPKVSISDSGKNK